MITPSIFEADEPNLLLGGAIYLMLLTPEDWIHRRVESIGLLDAVSFRRRVSIDFEVPDEELTGYAPVELVPLALIEKELLIDFDLRDAQGQSLPLLTSEQNSFVAWSALARVADFEISEASKAPTTVPTELLQDMSLIATLNAEDAEKLVDSFAERHASSPEARTLARSDFFMNLAYDLASNFLLLTPLEPGGPQRRIIKFAYAQELERRAGQAWPRLVARMGWGATQLDFQTPSVGQARSYHVELAPPAGLGVANAQLGIEDSAEEERRVSVSSAGHRIHAYASGPSPVAFGVLSVWLWPVRAGLVRTGVLTSLITAGVLGFLLLTDSFARLEGDVSAALLLTIPGFIAAMIVRPGEHSMVSELLLGVRLQIGLIGLIAYAAALSALGGFSEPTLGWIWFSLFLASGLIAVSLTLGYIGIFPSVAGVGLIPEVESGEENA